MIDKNEAIRYTTQAAGPVQLILPIKSASPAFTSKLIGMISYHLHTYILLLQARYLCKGLEWRRREAISTIYLPTYFVHAYLRNMAM